MIVSKVVLNEVMFPLLRWTYFNKSNFIKKNVRETESISSNQESLFITTIVTVNSVLVVSSPPGLTKSWSIIPVTYMKNVLVRDVKTYM